MKKVKSLSKTELNKNINRGKKWSKPLSALSFGSVCATIGLGLLTFILLASPVAPAAVITFGALTLVAGASTAGTLIAKTYVETVKNLCEDELKVREIEQSVEPTQENINNLAKNIVLRSNLNNTAAQISEHSQEGNTTDEQLEMELGEKLTEEQLAQYQALQTEEEEPTYTNGEQLEIDVNQAAEQNDSQEQATPEAADDISAEEERKEFLNRINLPENATQEQIQTRISYWNLLGQQERIGKIPESIANTLQQEPEEDDTNVNE